MKKLRVDWEGRVAAYRESGKSLAKYCEAAGIKIATMRHHVYKSKREAAEETVVQSGFHEVRLPSELVITRTASGELSLRGFEAKDLPALIEAWSHALQA